MPKISKSDAELIIKVAEEALLLALQNNEINKKADKAIKYLEALIKNSDPKIDDLLLLALLKRLRARFGIKEQ